VLEIGCGPATASVLLSAHGFRLTCLEPGARLAELARARLQADRDANVNVLTTTFEDWPLEAAAFDLVFAAQAFHWIDPAVRFVKSAQALRPGATLAIFANRPERGDTPLDRAIDAIYASLAQALNRRMAILTNTADNFARMFDESGLFEAPSCLAYRWREDYTAERYLRLLQTHSEHRLLPSAALAELLSTISRAIAEHGGTLRVPYTTVLCHARMKSP
jgi:SAM-dependent methyltransferase